MAKQVKKQLSAAFCKTTTTPGKYGDGNGLLLWVKPSGARSWVQRLVIHGKRRNLGLGGYPLVSLAEAREAAFKNRKLARAGGDPLALKLRPQVPLFEAAAAAVIKLYAGTWKGGGRSEQQWQASLRDYVFPGLGGKRVDLITSADVMAVLLPIWTVKGETARRVRRRIGTIMKWAIAQGYRSDNPAGDAISAALPKNGTGRAHHRAVPYGEVGAAIDTVRAATAFDLTKLAIEFLILTAARSGEVRKAQWSEIDHENGVWNVPAEHMKGGHDHRVPLSARALEVLAEAEKWSSGSDLIFASVTGRCMPSGALQQLLIENGVKATIHGFRSSFRDWAAERTSAPRAVMEAALAHTNTNQVEAAYARSDLFEKRRKLMETWAAFVSQEHGAQVVAIHG